MHACMYVWWVHGRAGEAGEGGAVLGGGGGLYIFPFLSRPWLRILTLIFSLFLRLLPALRRTYTSRESLQLRIWHGSAGIYFLEGILNRAPPPPPPKGRQEMRTLLIQKYPLVHIIWTPKIINQTTLYYVLEPNVNYVYFSSYLLPLAV